MPRNLGLCLCDHTQLLSRCVRMLFSVLALHGMHQIFQMVLTLLCSCTQMDCEGSQPEMISYPLDWSDMYHPEQMAVL